MAEGDGLLYDIFKSTVLNGQHNLGTGGHTLKIALFSSGYTPSVANDTSYTSLSYECSGSGYTAGGQALTNQVITLNTTTNTALVDGSDMTWLLLGTLNPQPSWAVLYNSTSSSKILIAYWQISTPTNGGNWTLQFSSTPSALITLA